MRTVTTKTTTSPSICVAIDSVDISLEVQSQFSNLGCECVSVASLHEFSEWLDREIPQMAIVSLDFVDQCGLDFCRERSELFSRVPIAFFAENPSQSFDKSLAAIRLGAVDVLTLPISEPKLERLAGLAHKQMRSVAWAPSNVTLDTSPAVHGSRREDTKGLWVERPSTTNGGHATAQVDTDALAATKPGSTSRRWVPIVPNGDSTPTMPVAASTVPIDECPNATARRQSYEARIKELESCILGSSPAMQSVRSTIAEVAETDANVMIYGASGTGKELVATALHRLSKRCSGPFEPVNMTEIPHDLAESLLFGHEKGAFTGADFRQIGVCEAADGGTLFLDEIGEMALATQPKLLRFLQEGTVKRIGSRNFKKVDVRVITATNRSPETIVKEGRMREDLFFRLHVVPIYIPPLHDRPEDIEQLATLFLRRYVKAYKRSVEGFTPAALDIFKMHDWPGNVRQLENVVERLVVFAKGRLIDVPEIPSEIHASSMFGDPLRTRTSNESSSVLVNTVPYLVDGQDPDAASAVASMSPIQRTERAAIIEALQRSGGHVIDAANLLGLGQATVYRKIKQYHIPHERRRRRRSPK
ncbi:MAG: sigma 54-interacting transcriptional regulator [Planctomycetota bacterium]